MAEAKLLCFLVFDHLCRWRHIFAICNYYFQLITSNKSAFRFLIDLKFLNPISKSLDSNRTRIGSRHLEGLPRPGNELGSF